MDQEGGGYSKIFYGGFTVSQLFSFIVTILLQSEQKRGVLYSLYIIIYDVIDICKELIVWLVV